MCRKKSCIKLNETVQSFQNIFYNKIISKNHSTWMENITMHLKKNSTDFKQIYVN